VLLPGLGTRTGDARRIFSGLRGYLASQGGYDRDHDMIEASYTGTQVGDAWRPMPYTPADTRQPFIESAEAVAGTLVWHRANLPAETRFCLVGYSIGGVALFDGATLALARDRDGWRGRIPTLVTIASPLRGCNAGPFIYWAGLATPDPDPLGNLAEELDRRWTDPEEQQRVTRRAAFLRANGVRLLTLADPNDAVVRPDEALLPGPSELAGNLLIEASRVRPGSLGHGAILDEPATWRRILAAVGRQVPLRNAAAAATETIEQDLRAIKERLRAEGRLPRQ
jgi:hypothetical protein